MLFARNQHWPWILDPLGALPVLPRSDGQNGLLVTSQEALPLSDHLSQASSSMANRACLLHGHIDQVFILQTQLLGRVVCRDTFAIHHETHLMATTSTSQVARLGSKSLSRDVNTA